MILSYCIKRSVFTHCRVSSANRKNVLGTHTCVQDKASSNSFLEPSVMARLSSVVCLCLLSLCGPSFGFSEKEQNYRRRRRNNNFDVLIFTQHWPQTVCYQWKEKSETNACALPKDDEWTIHGIWPTQYHVVGPLYCNQSLSFNASALAPLENDLNKKWVDVEKGREPYSFWRHEWEKHGTCAAVLESMDTEVKYFKKGLTLLDEYDMKDVLGRVGLFPGGSYSFQRIADAVKGKLGKSPQITCLQNSETGDSYLFEIRICFNKALVLIDCDGIPGYPTNCDQSKKIIYPGDVPSPYHVIQV